MREVLTLDARRAMYEKNRNEPQLEKVRLAVNEHDEDKHDGVG